ncbi:hypothetical protein WUBG_13095 [Wuchereria bancrofti]|uniref:Uncharacterized protein n=1 Tax=Wuchereria bancrofti TaxID=6293 RepID=J9ANU9_WUCBA|nr:hypothetical protein WUBG_13095 [Wuchereria bancrofti]VDM09926.1 unnamed protein product [Wuchereria bancrofti]
MQQDSAPNLYKLRNVYDSDLAIIPEIVDSALSHFFMKQLHKPMNLEIRIIPEIQNRRNVTLLIGDKESIEVDEKKYQHQCVCMRQREKEIQKLRLRMAFNELRKQWHQVYPGDENTVSPYRYNQSMQHLYMRSTNSSTSTAKPIATNIR